MTEWFQAHGPPTAGALMDPILSPGLDRERLALADAMAKAQEQLARAKILQPNTPPMSGVFHAQGKRTWKT